MSLFALDASATLPWCFTEEATPATEALLDRLRSGDQAIAPAHWPAEVMNALNMAVRRNRIDLSRVFQFAEALAALPIKIDPPSAPRFWKPLLTTSIDMRLTAYDAAYLQLARQNGVPLATLDRELRNAARAESIPLIELT